MRVLFVLALCLAVASAASLTEKIAADRAAAKIEYDYAEIVDDLASNNREARPMMPVLVEEAETAAPSYGTYQYAPQYAHPYYSYAHAMRFGQVAGGPAPTQPYQQYGYPYSAYPPVPPPMPSYLPPPPYIPLPQGPAPVKV